MLCPSLFILENAGNFATLLPASQAGHWHIFALSTTLFLVIVGGHQSETENGADPREGGKGVGAQFAVRALLKRSGY
jgi:hypothetical protein